MIDYDLKQKKLLLRMKNAQGAQAFAITLEKKGGKPNYLKARCMCWANL